MGVDVQYFRWGLRGLTLKIGEDRPKEFLPTCFLLDFLPWDGI